MRTENINSSNNSQANTNNTYQPTFSAFNIVYTIGRASAVGIMSTVLPTPAVVVRNTMMNTPAGGLIGAIRTVVRNNTYFTGLNSYLTAVAPAATIAISVNAGMEHYIDMTNPKEKMLVATLSGATAGLVTAPFEAAAQYKQIHKSSDKTVAQILSRAWRYNGMRGVFVGTAAITVRDALYHSSYLSILPMVSVAISAYIDNDLLADLMSAQMIGLFVGIVTTPTDTLRFQKQKSMMKTIPSYATLLKAEAAQSANNDLLMMVKTLFRGAAPRSVTIMLALTSIVLAEHVITKIEDAYEDNEPSGSGLIL